MRLRDGAMQCMVQDVQDSSPGRMGILSRRQFLRHHGERMGAFHCWVVSGEEDDVMLHVKLDDCCLLAIGLLLVEDW